MRKREVFSFGQQNLQGREWTTSESIWNTEKGIKMKRNEGMGD